ncbi:BamA/TamA family outer membrane protein [Candidatus Cytomitobacter indipagum]|uniref:BamA/TamA family outer membrane protein n=1 Tax=Candidatus Cytomitobacter indipagum TaxID=2601575 RepID=A0A5C0UF37_9PROT|nr:POTRA domain-containing protein [Candidatus Cytomitobacter indipagum]QEK38253.1 BamA/TamA family outer membrane protein [Candidatus Cytomitobacter indipagum]
MSLFIFLFLLTSGITLNCDSSSKSIDVMEKHSKRSYVISGNKRISKDLIVSILDSIDELNKDDIISSLSEQGYFEDIKVSRKNDQWIVSVKEFPILGKVTYEVKNSNPIEWEALTKLKKRSFVSPQTIKATEETIRMQYQIMEETSYVEVKSYSNEENGKIDLKFVVMVEKPKNINKVIFIGNKEISTEDLYDQIAKKHRAILKLFITKSISFSSLDQSKEQIEGHAYNLGYLDFRVNSMTVEKVKNEKILVVNLFEGKQYTVKNVSISSSIEKNYAAFLLQEIKKLIACKDLFSHEKINKAKQLIKDRLAYKYGRNYKVNHKIDKKNNEASIEFNAEEEKPKILNNIIINGNVRTHTDVILKRITLNPGDIISDKEILRTKKNLVWSGFCDNVQINVEDNKDNSDLIMDYKEKSTGSLVFKLSAALQKKMEYSFTFGYSDVNFLGLGKSLQSNVSISRESRSFGFEIEERFVNGKPVHVFAGADVFFLPAVEDNSFIDNRINFNTWSDQSPDSYRILSERIRYSDILEKTQNTENDKYAKLSLSEKKPDKVEKDDKKVYWSENSKTIETKTKGIEFRAGIHSSHKKHGLSLSISPSFKHIEVVDNSTYAKDSDEMYSKGVGITRFFDKDIKKFDKHKSQVALNIGHAFSMSDLAEKYTFSTKIGSTINVGTSNFLKNNIRMQITRYYGEKYNVSLEVNGGHITPIYNYSWMDNFKSANIRGFDIHGPRDAIRYNVLGGKKFLSSGIMFNAPLMLPKAFEARWFAFADIGSLWDCGLSARRVPESLCEMRGWDKNTADISQNKFKIVSSCGIGMEFKVAVLKMAISLNYPICGGKSPLNSFQSFNIGLTQ